MIRFRFYVNCHFTDTLRVLRFLNAIGLALGSVCSYLQILNLRERTFIDPYDKMKVLNKILNKDCAHVYKDTDLPYASSTAPS